MITHLDNIPSETPKALVYVYEHVLFVVKSCDFVVYG